jgi:hypothetical protein
MTTELSAAPSSHASDRADLYGGLGLGLATLAALVVANSALEPYYTAFLHLTGEVPRHHHRPAGYAISGLVPVEAGPLSVRSANRRAEELSVDAELKNFETARM